MVFFVGAGPGATDLITLRGQRLLEQADVVIYAGSLVNPQLLESVKQECEVYDSAGMTMEEIMEVMLSSVRCGKTVVRLHTGDPSIYSTLGEQANILDRENISYQVVPGVSSFCAAAAALGAEYTLPGVSQTLILTRVEGRTPMPEKEKIAALAAHGASMAVFLSAGLLEQLSDLLIEGGYSPETPAAVVYRASWPDQKTVRTTVAGIHNAAVEANITRTALVLIGSFLEENGERSLLYDPTFTHMYREGLHQ